MGSLLNQNGTIFSSHKISSTSGNFNGQLGNDDLFGTSLGGLILPDGSGFPDLAIGAIQDDDGGIIHTLRLIIRDQSGQYG